MSKGHKAVASKLTGPDGVVDSEVIGKHKDGR